MDADEVDDDYSKLDKLNAEVKVLAAVTGAAVEAAAAEKRKEIDNIRARIRASKHYTKRLEIAESTVAKAKKAREKAAAESEEQVEKQRAAKAKLDACDAELQKAL